MGTSDQVLVTGASGFVGSAVARVLLAKGFAVRALVRASSPRGNLHGLGLECVEGDLRDEAAVARAVGGVRFLFHVAADYRLWAHDPAELARTNVGGTRILMQAAQRARVERIVYTSSVATLALRQDGAAADESRPLEEAKATGAYKRSKIAAEALVRAMVEHESLPAVIVNPSTPIGPRDIKPTPTGRVILNAAAGRMPGYVDTGLNLVHVDDVAAGHLAALRRGNVGERYILGGSNVTLAELLRVVAHAAGRRAPTLRLPRPLLYPLAVAAEAWAGVSGREPFVTVDGLRMSRHRMYYRSDKAEQALGYTARPYEDGVRDAVAWFRAQGRLP